MIKQYRLWLLRQQRNRRRRRADELCANLHITLIDGRLYVANGATLIHRFADTYTVADVADKIDRIKRLNQ